ncbi:MAG: thioredoxin family protein [Myxococcales bacterium]|nr:thioredoxin family protein [Myxococcales bacterium]
MTRILRFFACGVLGLWLFSQPILHASAAPLKAPHIQLSLISETPTIRPGEPFWVGIRQDLEEHWHTYWRNAGDSGVPPKLTWKLPSGFQAGSIQWPTPKLIRVRILANFGYEERVLLPIKITPPKDLKAKQVQLSVDLTWLVCKEECIKGSGSLSLTLPVQSTGTPTSAPTSQHLAQKALFATTRAQTPIAWPQTKGVLRIGEDDVQIDLTDLPSAFANRKNLAFYPIDHSIISNAAPQKITWHGKTLRIAVEKNEYHTPERTKLRGLIVSREPNKPLLSYEVSAQTSVPLAKATSRPTSASIAKIATTKSPKPPTSSPQGSSLDRLLAKGGKDQEALQSVWFALLFAFLGGMLLNLMPCVFPVLSIKLLHFVEQAKSQPQVVKRHGWAFTAGVLLSFLGLSGILFLLRIPALQKLVGLESSLGWGYQLQSAAVLLPLILLFFGMGLSLSGLFEVGNSLMNVGSQLADQGGYMGSFFSGFLATIVATPCTAPFMGGAIAFALLQPPWVGLLIFAMLGLGMSFPYLLLSLNPSTLRILPRPGAWMETFKQIMAFPLYGAAIWLAWVLTSIAGPRGILITLVCALLVAFSGWLLHITAFGSNKRRWAGRAAVVIVLCTLVWGIPNQYQAQIDHRDAQRTALQEAFQEGRASAANAPRTTTKRAKTPSKTLKKTAFTRKKLEGLLKQKANIFLNFTADWCITCKANERLALRSDDVRKALQERGVHYVVGDWTDGNKEITQTLEQFKRSGVPLYVLFNGKDGSFRVLPQILTPQIVTNAIKNLPKP